MQEKIQIAQYINNLPCNDTRKAFSKKLQEMKEVYPEHGPFDHLFVSTLDGILETVKK